ncbi:MAG: hypothetical protein OEY11_13645 [Gammaproteobacteria bacterium]|nr:hypothetical protein [Gammaproteobacteria bacterium]
MKNDKLEKQKFRADYLTQRGLNIHAVFDLHNLPDELLLTLKNAAAEITDFSQLIVVGHLGRSMWNNVSQSLNKVSDPVDQHAVEAVRHFFKQYHGANHFEIIYPGDSVIGLQQLGALAGWHFSSPFKVGINQDWGSWFAYRAVVLADTNFIETDVYDTSSPCVSCRQHYCIKACPAAALVNADLNFQRCIDYRQQSASLCASRCLARVACPVGAEHRYDDEQLAYHYGVSLKTIKAGY